MDTSYELGPEPRIITPRFVAEAIAFTVLTGWQPEGHSGTLRLEYDHSGFREWRRDL
jgi:hypothetical protein